MVYVYVVIATVFAFRIGRPLIRLSFLSERLTANFRYALVRLRENAENVAFYQGEGVSAPRCASASWPTWPICGRASTGA